MKAIAIASILYLICMTNCPADWQYTKWGMTESQVIQASGGSARKNTDPSLHGKDFRTELIAAYRSGPFIFDAGFQFRAGRGLSSIELKAKNPSECSSIKNALINKYGRPHDAAPQIGLIKWWDRASGNIVIAYSVGDVYCAVSYQPLAPAGGSEGL